MASKCWLTKTEGEAMWLKILHFSLKSGSSYEIRHSVVESKYFYLNNNVLNGKMNAILWTKPYGGFLFVIHHSSVTLRRPPQDFKIGGRKSSGQRLIPWKITSKTKGGGGGVSIFFFVYLIFFLLHSLLLLFIFYRPCAVKKKSPGVSSVVWMRDLMSSVVWMNKPAAQVSDADPSPLKLHQSAKSTHSAKLPYLLNL